MFKRHGTDIERIKSFLQKERVCNLSMLFHGEPHITPMIYVYDEDNDAMYLHSAASGTKVTALEEDSRVAFSVMRHTAEQVIDTDGKPCGYGIEYESVVGYGKVTILYTREEKIAAYDKLSEKFKPAGHKLELNYRENELQGSVIFRLDIETKSGKAWDGINDVYYF